MSTWFTGGALNFRDGATVVGEDGCGCCGQASCDCSQFPHSHGIIDGDAIVASPPLSLASLDASAVGTLTLDPFGTPISNFMSYDGAAVDQGPSSLSCGSIVWPRRILQSRTTRTDIGPFERFALEYVAIESLSVAVVPSGSLSVVCEDIYPSSQMVFFTLRGRMRHYVQVVNADGFGTDLLYDKELYLAAIMQPDGELAVSSANTTNNVFPSCTSIEKLYLQFGKIGPNPNPVYTFLAYNTFYRLGSDVDQEVSVGPDQFNLRISGTILPASEEDGHVFNVSAAINRDVVRMCNDVDVETPITITGDGDDTGDGTPVGPGDGEQPRPGDGFGPGGGGGPGGTLPGGPGDTPGEGGGGVPGGINVNCETATCGEIRAEALRLFGDESLVLFVCPTRTDCIGGVLPSTGNDGPDPNPSESPNSSPPAPDGIPDHLRDENRFGCRGCGDG